VLFWKEEAETLPMAATAVAVWENLMVTYKKPGTGDKSRMDTRIIK
jgi:hypothetical protein